MRFGQPIILTSPHPPSSLPSPTSARERWATALVLGEVPLPATCHQSSGLGRGGSKCGETIDGSFETVNISNRNLRPLKRSSGVGVRGRSKRSGERTRQRPRHLKHQEIGKIDSSIVEAFRGTLTPDDVPALTDESASPSSRSVTGNRFPSNE